MTEKKFVYFFNEGKKEMKELLGGKGANLAEMTGLGVPVPPGFTITTEVCDLFYKNNLSYPEGVKEQVQENLSKLEDKMGKKLGEEADPLLVSVRSGAASSMPGMMDTILNLGLNDKSVVGLATKTNNERFAWDAYRRFIQMFGNVVMGIKHDKFEKVLESVKEAKNIHYDNELDIADLKKVVEGYKVVVKEEKGKEFPQNPIEQLWMAIDAVFGSWNNDRAILYRRLNDIRGLLGTAVNVQSMVFGNMGETSGTGVCFSRDPSTGERKFYGEYLMNAQGEDVVAGIRTPQPITALEQGMPQAYKELVEIKDKLEAHYKDMQDMEFTIQEGKLFFLQTRNGKRTAAAAVRTAVEMVEEGLIDEKTAILRVEPNQLNQLLHKRLDPKSLAESKVIATGLPASPGAAVGKVVFDAVEAAELAETGEKVVLVRTETSPEDLIGMNAAQGILTARGGMTSHAAVVARGMGKCCIAGCGDITINEETKEFKTKDGIVVKDGEFITLDGSEGNVYVGKVAVVDPDLSGNFAKLMEWSDKYRTLKVRTNADTPFDAQVARKFGAEGIGLCRTEHMFFAEDRITPMREMIVSRTVEQREKALAKLLPMQRSDFIGLFKAMEGDPVTIRLLDPPLHEFLPKEEAEKEKLAKELGIALSELEEITEKLHEQNPMLGHRGCRLAVTYPEILKMQVRAIIEAALDVNSNGMNVVPEIMIPLVGTSEELKYLKDISIQTIEEVLAGKGAHIEYKIGTMIEIPRAALIADKIAEHAEFFSFGTNDLTQMTFGYSRDDVGTFVPDYIKKGILEKDPFQVLDQTGVGQLVEMAAKKGRSVKPNLKLGICGEHGGEPSSVEFCHRIGLTYVSCSPYRVPIARLAAAHAALKN
ncbi:pyruvate, phosphate dikinase [Candidatus Woesearchaeota archaeon]|nr:pyruvate, phosphate dikinase [Candidatus Woesearchaeota archaeon]